MFRPGTRRRAQLAGPWASVGGVDVLVVQGPGQRGDPAAALVAPTHERAAGDGIFEWWATCNILHVSVISSCISLYLVISVISVISRYILLYPDRIS